MNSDQAPALGNDIEAPPGGGPGRSSGEDVTGRDRLVGNVLVSWGGYFVFVVAGFVMPRLIDDRIGRESLGVWDFAWSLIHYFTLIEAGVGGSVNRYVARYRAVGDLEGINRTAASVMCVQMVAALLVTAVTLGMYHWMGPLFGSRLSEYVEDARWVVLFLGMSLAVQMLLGVYVGTVTGCHRWGVHNLLNAGFYAAAVVGMITAVLMGGGLRSMALVYLCGSAARDVTRVFVAYRVCPGLRVRLSNARWGTMYRRITFGSKSLLPTVAELILNQTTNVLIMSFLGPVSLAYYCRPLALARHVKTFVNKFAFVLIPTASSLQARAEQAQLRSLFLDVTRWSYYISLPMILLLAIMGGPLLRVWMGPDYARNVLMAVVACGFLATVVQETIWSTLQGLNAHGWPGVLKLIGACVTAGAVLVVLKYLKGGLEATAVAALVPLTVVDGLVIPRYACQRLGVSLGQYLAALRGPAGCALPYAGWLLGARLLLANRPGTALVVGGVGGMVILAVLYWRELPERLRRSMAGALRTAAGWLTLGVLAARAPRGVEDSDGA